jgi:hypothetical protein
MDRKKVNVLDQRWVYIVLLGLVLIVYAKIVPKSNSSKGQQNPSIHEIEEMMEHFTAELEEQNNALIQLMAETKRDYELQTAKLAGRIEMLDKQSGQAAQQMAKLEIAYGELQKQAAKTGETQAAALSDIPFAAVELSAAKAPETELEIPVAMNMKIRYSELFAMYDQGKSTDYIAKKLSMNKGEVNLIIQLAKQEERLNAQQ